MMKMDILYFACVSTPAQCLYQNKGHMCSTADMNMVVCLYNTDGLVCADVVKGSHPLFLWLFPLNLIVLGKDVLCHTHHQNGIACAAQFLSLHKNRIRLFPVHAFFH